MDDLEKMFTATALSGLMSHAVCNTDEDVAAIASLAARVGRKTAAALRAPQDEPEAPKAPPKRAR